MKNILNLTGSWICYYIGDILSYGIRIKNDKVQLFFFEKYQKFMNKSSKLQDRLIGSVLYKHAPWLDVNKKG